MRVFATRPTAHLLPAALRLRHYGCAPAAVLRLVCLPLFASLRFSNLVAVQAVDKLDTMCAQRQYRAAANILDAVNQLCTHFDDYKAVPHISELQRTIRATKERLHRQVQMDIKRVVGDHDKYYKDDTIRLNARYADVPALHHKALADACCVVDSLGQTAREELCMWFCHHQLHEYHAEFAGQRDIRNSDRRFGWMQRHLRTHEERYEKPKVGPSPLPPHPGFRGLPVCSSSTQALRRPIAPCSHTEAARRGRSSARSRSSRCNGT